MRYFFSITCSAGKVLIHQASHYDSLPNESTSYPCSLAKPLAPSMHSVGPFREKFFTHFLLRSTLTGYLLHISQFIKSLAMCQVWFKQIFFLLTSVQVLSHKSMIISFLKFIGDKNNSCTMISCMRTIG